jgi:hypothetical protein
MKVKLERESAIKQNELDQRLLERVRQEIEEEKKAPKDIRQYLFPEIKPWQL